MVVKSNKTWYAGQTIPEVIFMTEKGKSYKENKRVLRHKNNVVPIIEHSAQMSLHSQKHKRGDSRFTRVPVSNGFFNTDLAQDNLQNDIPEADL